MYNTYGFKTEKNQKYCFTHKKYVFPGLGCRRGFERSDPLLFELPVVAGCGCRNLWNEPRDRRCTIEIAADRFGWTNLSSKLFQLTIPLKTTTLLNLKY